MGEIMKRFVRFTRPGLNQPTTPATGPKAPHSADWLYAKHKADQGFGEAPADPNTPAAPSSTTAAPTGGQIVDDEELARRKRAGLQI